MKNLFVFIIALMLLTVCCKTSVLTVSDDGNITTKVGENIKSVSLKSMSSVDSINADSVSNMIYAPIIHVIYECVTTKGPESIDFPFGGGYIGNIIVDDYFYSKYGSLDTLKKQTFIDATQDSIDLYMLFNPDIISASQKDSISYGKDIVNNYVWYKNRYTYNIAVRTTCKLKE